MPEIDPSELEKLRRELQAQSLEIKRLQKSKTRSNSRIRANRKSQRYMESAFWLVLGAVAAVAIGFSRSETGAWTYQIRTEIALALIASGSAAAIKIAEAQRIDASDKDDDDEEASDIDRNN